ncbi:MAG: class A beta-lactamase-related serine hydrolase [Clostridia bacterium]|nr:class A beta-lactamase-related serine hydrolase [Clostridia bacterium]
MINKAFKSSGMKTTYGIFIMDLRTGMYFGINENLTRIDPEDKHKEGYFNSASVVKLFQGYIVCDMLRKGELDINKVYKDAVTGRSFKLLNMIKAMISYSDNNYSNATLRLIGNKKSNEVLNRLGICNTRIYGEMSGAIGYSRSNNVKRYGTPKRCARITPRDAGLILYNVYRNKDSDMYMKALNQGLLGNIYNTRIPVGVKRVRPKYYIAHKTGTNSEMGVYNDAGIVYAKNPFILVTFTQSTSSSAGHAFIRSLAEQLTLYFDSRAK